MFSRFVVGGVRNPGGLVQGVREGVSGRELQTMRNPLAEGHLQRVVIGNFIRKIASLPGPRYGKHWAGFRPEPPENGLGQFWV